MIAGWCSAAAAAVGISAQAEPEVRFGIVDSAASCGMHSAEGGHCRASHCSQGGFHGYGFIREKEREVRFAAACSRSAQLSAVQEYRAKWRGSNRLRAEVDVC